MVDGGYDVADYRSVDPSLGTLSDFDKLLVEAHGRNLRVIVDLVPNHCSDQHPWFRSAVAAGPGSPQRGRFWFRRGRGADGELSPDADPSNGELPPNNWQSIFRGPAWTRVPDGEWYLHLFAPEQPDFNWEHPDVHAEFADILRFWLDRGVDGVRVDVAHGLVKAPGLPDTGGPGTSLFSGVETPFFDQDGVHDIYREWRSILDTYAPERIAVAEAWLGNPHRIARYVRPDELHQAFNFEFLGADWSGVNYRRAIDASLEAMGSVGAPTTWVLSNHDVVRPVSRLAGVPSGRAEGPAGDGAEGVELTVGLRRARAAALLMFALPGSVYVFQGEELGLPEVFDLPDSVRQDPVFARTGGAELGRDGCRVPLPWSGAQPPYGFGPTDSQPWLPQPASWSGLSVAAQQGDPSSTLAMYANALRLRREHASLGDGDLRWLSAPDDNVLVFERPARDGAPALICALNQGAEPVPVPSRGGGPPGQPLIASGPMPEDGMLPPDTAAWWTV
jgi:alpha-glucosidase